MSILLLPRTNSRVYLLPEGVRARWRVLAPLIALGGGVFGIVGAGYTEFTRGSLLVAFVGAPIIEEALKPSGVYLLLAKWPRTLQSRVYTALLSAMGGIAFAVIENLVYLKIYVPNPSAGLVLWRWTVCVGIHTICSFIFGFGIDQRLMASVNGHIKLFSTGKRFFVTAMVLHSLYNTLVFIFSSRLGFK